MQKGTQGSKIKIGKGSIEISKDKLTKLKAGEMMKIVSLVQMISENILDDADLDGRTVTLSYGNPSVVRVDLGKLSKLKYEDIRQSLKKLSDMQRRLVDDEISRLERVLGK